MKQSLHARNWHFTVKNNLYIYKDIHCLQFICTVVRQSPPLDYKLLQGRELPFAIV